MSVFELPRLHFRGTATTHLPTGPHSGLVDLATNTALTADGRPFPVDRPPTEYHDYLDRLGPRFDAQGRITPDGPFSAARGENFAGSGHFSVDARIISVETSPGRVDVSDPVTGRFVDMWGHYNEYLASTVNRARVFDVDPASEWTTTLMVGQSCFGRDGRSHDTGYMASGSVHGFHPPRWHNFRHVRAFEEHALAKRLRRSVVHQFVMSADDDLTWYDQADASPAVRRLRDVVASDACSGLVVQFALSDMAPPQAPDRPGRWHIRGTIAPWRPDELATYPAGRLLVPHRVDGGVRADSPHTMTVDLTGGHAIFNMITAVPSLRRDDPCEPPALVDLGDLELRTAGTGRLVARLPREAYLDKGYHLTSGIVMVPGETGAEAMRAEALCLVSAGHRSGEPWLREREINVQTDEASLIVEHPRGPDDRDHDVEVAVRSYVRGRPAPVQRIVVRQFFNPAALPRDEAARSAGARCGDVSVARLRPGRLGKPGTWSDTCVIDTGPAGRGWLTLRGARAGTARVLLSTGPDDLPCDPEQTGSAAIGYDHDDALGFWPGAGHLSLRVLPDDWHLADAQHRDVTFQHIYAEVFAYYEQVYSFMKTEVFALADQCRAETYAQLIWQMCDPHNKGKTYYMPPTRDLTHPQSALLLDFLRTQQQPHEVTRVLPSSHRPDGGMDSRGELVTALRQAVTLELAVMLQYLYAAYSVPTHGTALEYVRQELWTPEQLRLVCGDGGKTTDGGFRGTLLAVAREEMIHFLLANNILTAIGEPFFIPVIDFGTLNGELSVPLDFCLEALDRASIERFLVIEQPDDLVGEVRRGGLAPVPAARAGVGYGSISELYGNIREGLQRVPDLFLVDRGSGGGEHHLFLRESINRRHPDYQLQVDDLRSALFAVDVIREQGEGGVLAEGHEEDSHHSAFLRIADALATETSARPGGSRRRRWSPAYPVVRNPTLRQGNHALQTVTDTDARAVMRLFNRGYFLTLQLMAQHFGEGPDQSLRRSDLMNCAIDVMAGVMRPLAELLVTLPSGRRGRTAGPSFELDSQPACVPHPDVARRGIALRFDHLAAACRDNPLIPTQVAEVSAFWADRFRAAGG
ncbi:VioB - polyketide synthase [Streptomyces sp. MUM 136J]|uniref:ferritin-like domain-containing protein n=1 Tax=Streptomyces sp. MUM 136J TaxID=2791992 RepID=UPI001F041FED|nr:ferritin-like domain-containing protein [Streptomyces sp. MUM 136J]MCH0569832.1 VioB - polyketide synthase [Streptomyces sp. MUM 136J]